MTDQPSVLICAPTSIVKDYCFDAWLDNVSQFEYDNFYVYLADNSMDDKYSKKIRKLGIQCDWVKPKNKSIINRIAESHELCREVCLRSKFDYMFHLETDVFPPKNIINQLIAAKQRIIGGLYHIGRGAKSKLMVQLSEERESDYFNNTWNLGKDVFEFLDGNIKQVHSIGLGCLMINSSVLPKFKFRYVAGKNFHPDSYFALDMKGLGIPIFADTSILCSHRNQSHGVFGIDFNA